MHDIRMIRNKISHCHDLEAREVYESLDNIQRFFEMFQINKENQISRMKEEYVDKINNMRLMALEKLTKEEQYKQVIRSINASDQVFEFRGYNEIYKEICGLEFQAF
jgi:hypothetical protein